MALKTFNIDPDVYAEFSAYCKEHGISMSKRIEQFIKGELAKIRGEQEDHPEKTDNDLKQKRHPMGKYC